MERRQLVIIGALVGLGLILLVGLRACGGSGTETPSLIQQADDRVAQRAADRPQRRTGYVKREGLHIDIPYLGGRRLAELGPDVVDDQLGERLSATELPEAEEHMVFAQAEVWTHDGRIYRVRKQLAHPMDIPTALGTSGFPLDLGSPIDATNEVRWNSAWNQRRIRLLRNPSDHRLYDVIDVWRFLPKELH
jgi:hypothetical protein